MNEENGHGKLPTIELTWDAETQGVGMKFDPKQFKNWDFVEAVCKMAADFAKTQGAIAKMQHMQRLAMEQQASAQLAQQVLHGRR